MPFSNSKKTRSEALRTEAVCLVRWWAQCHWHPSSYAHKARSSLLHCFAVYTSDIFRCAYGCVTRWAVHLLICFNLVDLPEAVMSCIHWTDSGPKIGSVTIQCTYALADRKPRTTLLPLTNKLSDLGNSCPGDLNPAPHLITSWNFKPAAWTPTKYSYPL